MKIRMFTLPNMLTLCNLLCGCAAIYYCLGRQDLVTAFWLMVAAAVFDFSDGFAARLTGQYSELGKQLDSLADMVSFGVLPSAILFEIFMVCQGVTDWLPYGFPLKLLYGILLASVALFSALRLARFNIDETQSKEFRGLPTPACALFVGSAGWLFDNGYFMTNPLVVIAVALVLSYFLVSPVRMFALKFSDWSWKNNKVRYIFLIASAAALAIWHIAAVPFIITGYVAVSVCLGAVCRKGGAGSAPEGEMPPSR